MKKEKGGYLNLMSKGEKDKNFRKIYYQISAGDCQVVFQSGVILMRL